MKQNEASESIKAFEMACAAEKSARIRSLRDTAYLAWVAWKKAKVALEDAWEDAKSNTCYDSWKIWLEVRNKSWEIKKRESRES